MKVLVFLCGTGLISPNGQHIDMAIEEIKKENQVFYLACDSSIGLCMNNPLKNPIYCKYCQFCTRNDVKHLAPAGTKINWMHEYTKDVDREDLPSFDYKDAAELKAITYQGVDIGLGVMSTYISLTRNLNPKITQVTKSYFDALIEEQLVILHVIQKLQQKHKFGLFIFQNGRGSQLKPFLNYCQTNNIDFWCTEDFGYSRKRNYMNNFWCDIPHSISAYNKKYKECWETSIETFEEREKIARSFFENRRNAIPAGDKVYVKNQEKGLMPDDWNDNVENIVFFNSSEDEFCSVSKEFDDAKFFKNQVEGVKQIVEHYVGDKTKHFTLRIHPNLMKIPYKYHTDFYKLKYPNLTVVSGDSPVSTYSLMDAADKIIVFGSTAGIESVYWGKPVICLAASFYRDLHLVYNPQNIDDLWKTIETKDLPCLYNERILEYGYFYMSDNHERTKHINIDTYSINFKGKRRLCFKYQKLFGSTWIYLIVNTIFDKVIARRFFVAFNHLPTEEA